MRKFLVLAVLLGGAAPVISQSTADSPPADPRFEASLVVTASLEEEQVERLAVSVEIIEAEEIASRQSTSVADLLRTVPGLTVMRSGSPGKVTSLFSRGSESDHTLALWNGIELNNPYFGGFDWAFLPTDGVRRIEVARGPFSAVHGSDALGGVVQVLTGGRSGGSLRLEAGADDYLRLGVDSGWSRPGFEIDVTGSLRRGKGEVENDFFDSQDVAVSARWQASDALSVSIVARGNESDNGIPFSAGIPSPERQISWSERQVAIPVSYRAGGWELDGRVSHVSYTTAFRDPEDAFGFTDYNTDSRSDRLRVSAARHFSEASWIAFGGEAEELEVDDRSVFGVTLAGAGQTTRSLFGQVAHTVGGVRFDLGVRHDDNDVFGDRTTPKVGVLLPLGEKAKLRASWGEGFRAPSVGELFFPFSGNAALEPEASESWEIGVEHRAGSWTAGATLFDNQFTNLIDFDFATYTNRNIGRASSRGVELSLRRAGDLLAATVNATFLETEDLATGEPLLRRPDESAALILTARPHDWDFGFTAAFVGERTDVDAVTFARVVLPSHVRLDLAARLERWQRIQPYARLENLANEEYEEVAGFPAPGRRLIVGLASSWQ